MQTWVNLHVIHIMGKHNRLPTFGRFDVCHKKLCIDVWEIFSASSLGTLRSTNYDYVKKYLVSFSSVNSVFQILKM